MNNILKCTYSVTTPMGTIHMIGREAVGRFGWDNFQSDYVQHSQYCTVHPITPSLSDPFRVEGVEIDPPF